MKQQYNQFGLTAVSYKNNIISLLESGAYVNADNEEMVKSANDVLVGRKEEGALWETLEFLEKNFSIDEIKKFYSSAATANLDYLKYLINKTIFVGNLEIGTTYVNSTVLEQNPDNYVKDYKYLGKIVLPISFAMLYIIILISIIYLIYNLIKTKKIEWIMAFFVSMIFTNIFTLIVGAPFEAERLFAPSMVLVILMIIYYVEKFIIKKCKTNE